MQGTKTALRHAAIAVAGPEARKHTSFAIGGAINAGPKFVPKAVLNASVEGSYWSGSDAYREWEGETGQHDKHFAWNAGVQTPYGGVNFGNYTRLGASLTPIPWVRGYETGRTHGIGIGPKGVLSLSLGNAVAQNETQFARGPYLGMTVGLPLELFTEGVVRIHPSLKFELYHPMFGPLVNKAEPLANWVAAKETAAKNKFRVVVHSVSDHLHIHRPEHHDPTNPAPSMASLPGEVLPSPADAAHLSLPPRLY